MIINNTYFHGNIYIPHAKPSISDPVTGVDNEVISFINKYAEDCGIKCFGSQLFSELKLNLDSNEASWVDPLAEDKWDELVNGDEYTDPITGKDVIWKGIRFKNEFDTTNKYYSFLANYVYFFYQKHNWITSSEIGSQIEQSENSQTIPPNSKAVNAWNEFVTLVQGEYGNEQVVVKENFGFGIDYFKGGNEVSLYKFINDKNIISENTYANFNPKKWKRIDNFNLV